MRNLTISILVLLCSLPGYAQFIYFGYPDYQNEDSLHTLNKGDVIIVNLPEFYDHLKFLKSNGVLKLCRFLNAYSERQFQIEVHIVLYEEEFNKKVSERLKNSLEKLLGEECNKANYTIISKGSTAPLDPVAESPRYRTLNSRIQIIVQ